MEMKTYLFWLFKFAFFFPSKCSYPAAGLANMELGICSQSKKLSSVCPCARTNNLITDVQYDEKYIMHYYEKHIMHIQMFMEAWNLNDMPHWLPL